jgi:hypothetical protein
MHDTITERERAEHAERMAALEASYEAEYAALEQRIEAAHAALDALSAPRLS